MAIIEAYQWGLEVGAGEAKQEFIIRLQRGSVKPKQLDDALGFCHCPKGMSAVCILANIFPAGCA